MGATAVVKRAALGTIPYVIIIGITLVVVDVATMVLGVFPPTPRYGHPVAGWVAGEPTGRVEENVCVEYSTGERHSFVRNEDGVRAALAAGRLRSAPDLITIGATGDSHTDLCAANPRVHFGYTETYLQSAGIPAAVFAYGAGRYSPLQAYLAIRDRLLDYSADVLILNLYTGNDFYDMLRVDDRPHLRAAEGGGYEIAPPVWYTRDPPGTRRRSRVLFAFRSMADAVGVRSLSVRARYLFDAARLHGANLGAVARYVRDLRRASAPEVGYPDAFSAQALNQQLFFHHFPGSREESLRRVRAVLDLVRAAHPGMVLVLSPLPSFQAVGQEPYDTAFLAALDRLPLTLEGGASEERKLYRRLEELAAEAGWVFVDNLHRLQAYQGTERLYNDFDYHILPVASEIIGRAQAEALVPYLTGEWAARAVLPEWPGSGRAGGAASTVRPRGGQEGP